MIKEVYPKRIDIKAAQLEFQRLVDAFLDVAEAESAGNESGQSAPTQDSPVSMPVSINGNPR